MDVNETLKVIRRLSTLQQRGGLGFDDTDVLIDHVLALDEWMSRGGALPADWTLVPREQFKVV